MHPVPKFAHNYTKGQYPCTVITAHACICKLFVMLHSLAFFHAFVISNKKLRQYSVQCTCISLPTLYLYSLSLGKRFAELEMKLLLLQVPV